MPNEQLHYKELSKQEWEREIKYILRIIEAFVQTNNIDKLSISINENALFQIISKVHQRKQYFIFFHKLNMSDFKELALNCFWIIKLKPLSLLQESLTMEDRLELNSINEKFAVYYLIKKFRALVHDCEMSQERVDNFFDEKYIYELFYSFVYRDVSKEAMILLVETMAKALGFEPYKDNK